jgi:hypothetical protein
MSAKLLPGLLQAHGVQVAAEAWSAFESYFYARLRLREDPDVAVRQQMKIYGESCRAADRALHRAKRARGDAVPAARAEAEQACAGRDAHKAMLIAAMQEAQPAARLKLAAEMKAAGGLLPLETRDSLVHLAETLLSKFEPHAAA